MFILGVLYIALRTYDILEFKIVVINGAVENRITSARSNVRVARVFAGMQSVMRQVAKVVGVLAGTCRFFQV